MANAILNWAVVYARITLGTAFLSSVADRFGLWHGRNGGFGNFAVFLQYTAKVNSFMAPWTIPYLAWTATLAETLLGLLLVLGVWRRRVALASGVLLILFGSAMAVSFGLKSSLDYSVFSASSAALLLAAVASPEPEQEWI